MIYMAGWAVMCGVLFLKPTAGFFSMLAIVLLPGALVAGPIGFAFGGREWFWPATVIGSIVWLIMLLTPIFPTT